MRKWIVTGEKGKRMVLLGGLAGLLGFSGVYSAHAQAAGYYSKNNAPEFYGLTKAVIQTGDTFATDDTRFRIFAKDFEDGDMTGKIKIVSNTVDTSQAGEYEIKYQVTDTDGNVSELMVPITVQDDCENRYFERTLYSLPSVQNMAMAGTNRGNAHDRQMLGFYMEQGASIQVKVVSGTDKLNLNYWNNDSQTEFSQTITGEAATIMSEVAGGVPFIQTVYGVEEPVVVGVTTNYVNTVTVDGNEITGKVTELPYYYYEDNEEEFFREWEANTDSYAVIDSEDLTTLVPYADREYLVNYYKKCHTSLDGFLSFWHKTMAEYDAFLGLSYNPKDPIDQNVKTKYFVKANAHGAGAAYYGGSHVGINRSSVASFFEVNWGGLHEVGHGYQGSLAHTGMELGEVSNNILGHYVQINKDIYTYNDDWLGAIMNIEQKINNQRLDGKVFSELEAGERLYILVNLLDTYDAKETYAKINQLWRRALMEKQDITSQEAYVLAMYHLYNVNVTPYFEAWGLAISDGVKERVSGSKNLYCLADIVNDSEQAESIRQDLSKEGIYSLVSSQELMEYKMKGNLNLSISMDGMENIIGKKIILQNGEDYKKEITVTGKDVLIEDVPAGLYEIKLPVPKESVYEYTPILYAVVKNETTNTVPILYEKSTEGQPITDTMFRFNGLGDATFATITFTDAGTMKVISNHTKPHVYFTDEYAGINVYNAENELVYSKNYIGDQNSEAAEDEITIAPGFKIEIMHREAATRLVPYSNILGETDSGLVPTEKVTSYMVGEYGLYKEASDDESYTNYKARLDEYIQKIMEELSEEDLNNKNKETVLKKNLLTGILKLKEEEKEAYLEKYRFIFNGSCPAISENEVTVMQNKEFNLYDLFYATDMEDGKILLNEENASFFNVPDKAAEIGDYQLPYEITDSDGNVTKGSVTLHLVANTESVAGDTKSEQQHKDGSNPSEVSSNGVAVQAVTITGISKKIAAGKKIKLTPAFTPSDASNQKLIWTSSNTKYARVSQNGVVTTKKKGIGKKVTITAVTSDGSNVKVSYKIKIVKHAVKRIRLNTTSKTVKAEKKLRIKAAVKTTGKTANKTLQWSSSNNQYATVSKKGGVTAKKAGKGKNVKITARATDGTGKKATINIKIK